MNASLPVRGTGPIVLDGLPTPPARLPLLNARRPRKQWRYVGAYGDDVMLCAGKASIGGLPQAWYAVWDRTTTLREKTVFKPGAVEVGSRVRFPGADLAVEPFGDVVEVVSPHGASYIWTRKQPVRVHGTVDGRAVDLFGLTDDSAGFHARVTRWSWSAGAGVLTDGRGVLWNLVDGVHDVAPATELTIWVDGVAAEPGPVRFDGLDAITFPGGEELRFTAEATRARHDRLIFMDSRYSQPFGVFQGSLPGGLELATAYGVMERHDVRW